MKVWITRDREAGNVIEAFRTEAEARGKIALYEEMDRREDIFEPDFYEAVEYEIESIRGLQYAFGKNLTWIAERFGIPYRTAQNWQAEGNNERSCPRYILDMMTELLLIED